MHQSGGRERKKKEARATGLARFVHNGAESLGEFAVGREHGVVVDGDEGAPELGLGDALGGAEVGLEGVGGGGGGAEAEGGGGEGVDGAEPRGEVGVATDLSDGLRRNRI